MLQPHDKTAQIRIRGSLLVLLGVAALSVTLGLSPIIGAFLRVGWPQSRALGLLNATSISFIVPAANLGVHLHRISPADGGAMIAAGLLSVILFPAGAMPTLRSVARRVGTSAGAAVTLGTPAAATADPEPPGDVPGFPGVDHPQALRVAGGRHFGRSFGIRNQSSRYTTT